jgi:hypothetical protein
MLLHLEVQLSFISTEIVVEMMMMMVVMMMPMIPLATQTIQGIPKRTNQIYKKKSNFISDIWGLQLGL